MFDNAITWATSNPILVGGVGTLLFGSLLYLAKAIPSTIYNSIRRMLTIDFTMTSEAYLYEEVIEILSKSRVPLFCRSYAISQKTGRTLGAGFGSSIGFYRGRLVFFHRQLMDGKLYLFEQVHATLFSRNTKLLEKILEEAAAPKNDDDITVYLSVAASWNYSTKKRKRPLDTVFCNNGTKQDIINEIDWFFANEDWYRRRGMPYKKVFLLSGPPGCGKSSLIYAISSHFNRNVASMTNVLNVGQLLSNIPENAFVAIEDIDMLAISRDESPQDMPAPPTLTGKLEIKSISAKTALHHLINTLDGLATPEGMVVFITTNYKDRLDPALIRPGRIDHDIEIGPLNAQATEEMFVSFYGDEYRYLIRGYTTSRHFIPQTGAECQRVFMACKSANEAVHELHRREGEVVHRLGTVSG
jgi:chaperone BCS1